MLELEAGRGRFFDGPWHAWRKEKAARELALGRAIERQEAEIERLERFVTRFRAGTRARQAQSRAKKLSKMDRINRPQSDGAALEFAFKPPERSGRVVFELLDAAISAGDKELLDDAELWLERGEHVSLVGPNGAGKTTLIETLAGRRRARSVASSAPATTSRSAYLSQHADELNTGTARTVLEAAQHATELTPGKARALLGRFLFSGEDAEKPLDGLSGGERRRLSLAILVQSGANVLILDEPTNHLDLESREALEEALSEFPARCCSSRTTGRCSTRSGRRTVAVEDQTLHTYVGGWPEYVRVRAERAAAPAPRASPAHPRRSASAPSAKRNPPRASNGEIEQQIEAAEAALRAIEDELADPGAWSTPEKSAASTARHEQAKRAVEELYARWEDAGRLDEFAQAFPPPRVSYSADAKSGRDSRRLSMSPNEMFRELSRPRGADALLADAQTIGARLRAARGVQLRPPRGTGRGGPRLRAVARAAVPGVVRGLPRGAGSGRRRAGRRSRSGPAGSRRSNRARSLSCLPRARAHHVIRPGPGP